MTSVKVNAADIKKVGILVLVFLFVSIAHAAVAQANQKCVSKWSEIATLKPISGISNLDAVLAAGQIQFLMASGKTFTLTNRRGNIYAQTPEGNTDIKLCKQPGKNGQVVAIADTFLGRKVVNVTHQGGKKFTIVDPSNPGSSVQATVQ